MRLFRFKLFPKNFKTLSYHLSKVLETGDVVAPLALLGVSISNFLISIHEDLAKILGGMSLFIIFFYLIVYVCVNVKLLCYFLIVQFRNKND